MMYYINHKIQKQLFNKINIKTMIFQREKTEENAIILL